MVPDDEFESPTYALPFETPSFRLFVSTHNRKLFPVGSVTRYGIVRCSTS